MQGGDEHDGGHEDSDGTKVVVMRRMRMILAIMKVMMSALVLMRTFMISVVTVMLTLIRKRWVVMLTVVRMMVLMVVMISEGDSNSLHFRINVKSRLEDQLNGHEFEQTLGDSGRQGSLVCCSPWGHKELDLATEQQRQTAIL